MLEHRNNVKVKKLKNCRNCFRIVSNHKYVIANGDSITVYRQDDLSVQCTIPSKIFPHAYCCRFLSDDTIMVKNNDAHYMVYDIAQGSVLWKFKANGYNSIDNHYLVSSDGEMIFDIVFPLNGKGTVMELIAFPKKKCYLLFPLQEPAPCQAGWVRYPSIHITKDAADGIYIAYTFGPPQPSPVQKERGFVLQHKNQFIGQDYETVKEWTCMEPVSLGTHSTSNGIKYLDAEHIIFTDLKYWNLITHQYGRLPDISCKNTCFRLERKSNALHRLSFFMVHERYNTDPIVFSLLDFATPNTVNLRDRISLISALDYRLIETFDHIEGIEDNEICDIELLDTPNRFLVGTMSGIYLYEH